MDSPTPPIVIDDPNGSAMDACFTAFDKDGDDRLSLAEFTLICRALFRNDKGHIYDVPADRLQQIFEVFDTDGDGYIDREEFKFCWNRWIKTILEPTNNLLDTVDFDAVFYSLDWHPSDHVSFIDNVKMRPMDESSPIDADSAQVFDTVIFAGPPPMKQRLWPRHCVQDSWGAELHKELKVVDNGIKIYKGTNPEVDSYSVFWDNKKLSDTTLNAQLKMKGTTDIYVCGLAYDVCVGATAVDALSVGYRTILIDDCCRGTDFHDIERTKEKVITNHGVIVHSSEVRGMVEGRDRRPELGYKLAMELKNPDSALSQRNGIRHID
ncbi:PREDICTED: nicotinamidase isoform X2 [Rhagoletis zephyria]|uniref:nicotinamidase isoform X2 n=1 Tax=Rhagoletis zephyria TaxID=28612 RepID=UPI0008115515|nr:PREDICTED: nicotinamidase isoform X2 [Rhagoletis zephyria]